ncbi:beta-1,3-galactosyltransferase 2 [Syngnathus typhle]|uniref:beta-1,3-galactosyltransferase 2 n=1 Tax=Syngnathus typhle TaxID=161592 RepID=UPI002A6B0EAA|nr:beta-1,3-galactosyltransferase 2 [Syngnathus typhle]XP_061153774.1 beta-1,3-galactosyltransferase 2 [Syngnathus typhle]XP_061153775.1 beta-1,3-galactosyltransferase 2 [Syngnathus typhle]XP_061153776.1 beta-1,3-galactosyltransferase 2 [Syngnathus typhle]
MQWRRRHCCPLKMTWTAKRSLFRTHVAGLLSLALLFTLFSFFSRQDWLPGRSGPRENPLAYTVRGFRNARGEANQSSSLRSLWREAGVVAAKPPPLNLSSQPAGGLAGEAGGGLGGGGAARVAVMGLGDSMSTNNSLQKEMDVGGKLSAHPYRYILNQPFKCSDSTPFLVLLVAAEPGQADARKAIRQTWGNDSVAMGLGFVRLFLLGVGESSDASLQSSIEEESRLYRDIIQQEYRDTYYNLTIKTLMAMNWVATYCAHASYVMKTDSDMFVNTEYLIQKLLKPELPPRRRYFTGYLMRGYAPNRNKDSKWYMPPELYPSERYPTFCSGTGYVFSGDMAELIYQASLGIRRLHLEDVYVGICLAKLRIDPTPPPNEFLFNHWRVSYSSCKYSHLITSHQFHPNELVKYWNHLQSNKHNACVNTAKEKNGRYRQRRFHGERPP